MAHPDETRRAVRASYVFDQLSLEMAALKHGISFQTVRGWKRTGLNCGDDWDKARGAQMIAGGGIEDVVRQTLGVVVQQVQATMDAIRLDTEMQPELKVKLLASLSDSYFKMVSVSRRLMPETDKLAVATDVVKRLADFTRTKHPKHAAALMEVIEPFADELAKAYV